MVTNASRIIDVIIDVVMEGYERRVMETGEADPNWPQAQFMKWVEVLSDTYRVPVPMLWKAWQVEPDEKM